MQKHRGPAKPIGRYAAERCRWQIPNIHTRVRVIRLGRLVARIPFSKTSHRQWLKRSPHCAGGAGTESAAGNLSVAEHAKGAKPNNISGKQCPRRSGDNIFLSLSDERKRGIRPPTEPPPTLPPLPLSTWLNQERPLFSDSLSSDGGSRAAGKWLREQCSGLIALF